jgi:hypothetical protein
MIRCEMCGERVRTLDSLCGVYCYRCWHAMTGGVYADKCAGKCAECDKPEKGEKDGSDQGA